MRGEERENKDKSQESLERVRGGRRTGELSGSIKREEDLGVNFRRCDDNNNNIYITKFAF